MSRYRFIFSARGLAGQEWVPRMTISQTAEYALRAVVWLAIEPDRAVGTPRIARATKVPAGYLSRVLQSLARAGLVTSNPGRSGGFRLARLPKDISVLDVVNAVDPIRRIDKCPLNIDDHGLNLCPLHRRLDAAIAATESAFRETKIAELLSDPSRSRPLCSSDDFDEVTARTRLQ